MKAMIAIAVLLFAFIYYAEGVLLNPFALWNAMPLVFALFFFWLGIHNRNPAMRWGAIGFLVASMGLSLFGHVAWMIDWGTTATGSSTSALLFLYLPVYATGLGFVGLGIGWAAARILGRKDA